METVIIGDKGIEWTDTPRPLTKDEADQISAVNYLEGVKLHRQFTHSTLAAASRIVCAMISREE